MAKSIPNGSVTSDKIGNNSITLDKINTNGAISGQTPTFNGSNLVWQNPGGGGVTELDQGAGIILSPNPITSKGTISLANPYPGNFSASGYIRANEDNLLAGASIRANVDNKASSGIVLLGSQRQAIDELGFGVNRDNGALYINPFSVGGVKTAAAYVGASGKNGTIYLTNANGNVTIMLDGSSGEITGTTKHFRIADPLDKTKQIVYTSLEGPEAAAYFRGKFKLKNGHAFIKYPNYFGSIIDDSTITFNLTPLSSNSKGLAVVKKNRTGFEVKELFHGHGNYSFDYTVTGVRKGYENYKVVQDKINPDLK